jgi:hypothetical protein
MNGVRRTIREEPIKLRSTLHPLQTNFALFSPHPPQHVHVLSGLASDRAKTLFDLLLEILTPNTIILFFNVGDSRPVN